MIISAQGPYWNLISFSFFIIEQMVHTLFSCILWMELFLVTVNVSGIWATFGFSVLPFDGIGAFMLHRIILLLFFLEIFIVIDRSPTLFLVFFFLNFTFRKYLLSCYNKVAKSICWMISISIACLCNWSCYLTKVRKPVGWRVEIQQNFIWYTDKSWISLASSLKTHHFELVTFHSV